MRFATKLICALTVAVGSAVSYGDGYPSKPITFIIPFAAGGDSDLSGRNLAQHASKYLNHQPIIPVNRAGASGMIGTVAAHNAPPDGYTLLIARIGTHAIVPAVDSKAPYRWNDFTMLSMIEMNPYICVVPAEAPYLTAAELIAAIRAKPGKLNYANVGAGSSQNMAVQYLLSLAGLGKDAAVGVPYKGGGEVTTAVLGGQVQFACNNAPTVIPQVKSGRMRALLVTPARISDLPEAPSAAEAGYPDMAKIVGWSALMGPPGLPKEVVDKWADVLARIAGDADWLAGNARIGGIVAIRSKEETEKYVHEQVDLYGSLASSLGIRE